MEHEQHAAEDHGTHRKKRDDLSIPLAIVFAGVLVGGAIIFSDRTAPPTAIKDVVPIREEVGADGDMAPIAELMLKEDDHVLGNPNADVLIIEYSDTECPFCKKFHETMMQVTDQYAKSGDVAWVYRHFPLDMIHPKARKEAEAQECANELGGNDAFWKYTDKLFEITPSNNGLDASELPRIAGLVGLDVERFSACLASGRYAERVERDFISGVEVGVKGTPYSIVWNRKTGKQMPVNGAALFTQVKSILGVVGNAPAVKP